jgi:putative transposase
MYNYRQLTFEQQREIVEYRKRHGRPWHSPPHWEFSGEKQFLISAACYEHAPIIGVSPERITECEATLLELCEQYPTTLYAWCILPNHYHVLLKTEQTKKLLRELGKMHGRSSYQWNLADNQQGRKVWHRCFDRDIRSHRHFWASMNYVHHNPVHHGYVQRWQDWPWSSATEFLEKVGAETARKIWQEYPILDYGKQWDVD